MAAGNEWINGYLEAILDAGSKIREQALSPLALLAAAAAPAPAPAANEDGKKQLLAAYSPAKYFVEEVVSRFDDRDIHKTWTKVVATRNSQERNNRLENLCWRIWHLARKKKQVTWEYARQVSRRRREQEKAVREAAEDLSELSEGEKDIKAAVDGGSSVNQTGGGAGAFFPRSNSEILRVASEDEEADDGKGKRLYIVLISIHGLVRGENMELGRDSDTGGQVRYVVELARALAATKGVLRVDLLTRQISSPDVDWTYGEPVEMLTRQSDGDAGAAYLVRLPCGPKDKYIAKESLWPHIPEFVDRALGHITNVARALGEGPSGPLWPYAIHGHYADAAEVAAHLAAALNVPMVMTGHSLGRNKLEQLLKMGRMTVSEIHSTYRILRRIEAEEVGLDSADVVVTSTKQEVEDQWGLYDGFDLIVDRKLRARRKRGVSCLGRYMPTMLVIPPGMDFSYVNAEDVMDGDGDLQELVSKRDLPPIWAEISRFFTNPHKPMILALSRPDPKKNVVTLLKAYGESRKLRELANLTLILGNRDDIEEMNSSAAGVLTTVLKLIDRYDLYGQVAYPKHHKQSDVPEIYRLAAKTKGVFINPALVEPFGLTLIEAAAYGLPVVATMNGGPVDILKVLNNGLLVDPHDADAVAAALMSLLADKTKWLECRRKGLRNIHRFSWPHHCRLYLSYLAMHCHSTPRPTLTAADNAAAGAAGAADESLSDSLRDLSLRLSVDTNATDGDTAAAILDAVRRRRRCPDGSCDSGAAVIGYGPGRRMQLLVVAADCYGAAGEPAVASMQQVISNAIAVAEAAAGSVGLVLATGSTVAEAQSLLSSCGVNAASFDALIGSSGAELHYPWRPADADEGTEDEEYGMHIGFRWPGDHVKTAIDKVAVAEGAAEDVLVFDGAASSAHCFAFAVRAPGKVRKVDAVRQGLRMRGFRCNLVYARAGTRLNVIPLFASRPRALRYLSIQWGIDLAKVVAFVGDKGDTDHERLLPGLHRTVIFGGIVDGDSGGLLRDEGSFKKDDVVWMESPNISFVAPGGAAPAGELIGNSS